jgi:hypothetical protein
MGRKLRRTGWEGRYQQEMERLRKLNVFEDLKNDH